MISFVCAVGTPNIFYAAGPTLFRSYDVAKKKKFQLYYLGGHLTNIQSSYLF